jgi:hypothetical protein
MDWMPLLFIVIFTLGVLFGRGASRYDLKLLQERCDDLSYRLYGVNRGGSGEEGK